MADICHVGPDTPVPTRVRSRLCESFSQYEHGRGAGFSLAADGIVACQILSLPALSRRARATPLQA